MIVSRTHATCKDLTEARHCQQPQGTDARDVSIRADIATVAAAAGSVGAAPAPAAKAAAAPAPATRSTPAAAPAGPRPAGDRVIASPMAKTLAAERGINLADIAGTGPEGRITASDVEAYKNPVDGKKDGAKAEKKKEEGPKIGTDSFLEPVLLHFSSVPLSSYAPQRVA